MGMGNGLYTAAGSQAIFDASGASWCGAACGICFDLISTGKSPCTGCGTGGDAGKRITVMVTNLCPHNGNEQWCPTVGGKNEYGYSYHFDLEATAPILGDNSVVDFEPVACPKMALSNFGQCECSNGSGGGTKTSRRGRRGEFSVSWRAESRRHS